MYLLAAHLQIPRPYAVGLMESIWQWVAKYAPTGVLVPDSMPAMVEKIGWAGGVERLLCALKNSRLLEPCGNGESAIHDWHDHCEDAVHMYLARHLLHFAGGRRPKLHRFARDEREAIEAQYEALLVRTPCALPLPLPMPEPMPEPQAAASTPPENRETAHAPPNEKPKRILRERDFRAMVATKSMSPCASEFARTPMQIAELEAIARDELQPHAVRKLAGELLELARSEQPARKVAGSDAPERRGRAAAS